MLCIGGQATSQLVNALKTEAESQSDSEQQKKLLAAAKLLADATARMVEAAKVHIAQYTCAIVTAFCRIDIIYHLAFWTVLFLHKKHTINSI